MCYFNDIYSKNKYIFLKHKWTTRGHKAHNKCHVQNVVKLSRTEVYQS